MVQNMLFEPDSLSRIAELEGRYGRELDRMLPPEIQELALAMFSGRGKEFPVSLVRRYGTHSKLVRPVLLRALARQSRRAA